MSQGTSHSHSSQYRYRYRHSMQHKSCTQFFGFLFLRAGTQKTQVAMMGSNLKGIAGPNAVMEQQPE